MTCGEVELVPDDIHLWICVGKEQDSYYHFTCPFCRCQTRRPANSRVAQLLIYAQVPQSNFTPLTEADEVAQMADKPPLTKDDVLNMVLDLQDPHFVEHMRAKLVSGQ